MFANDPEFDEIVRLGRQYRDQANTAEFRKRLWTDVLKSLELSFDLICHEARQFNEQSRKRLEEHPGAFPEDFIADLEERIERLRVKYFGGTSTRESS